MTQFKFLKKGQVLKFEAAASLHMISGELWVTLERDWTDHVLKGHDHIHNPEKSVMVLEALESSLFIYSEQALEAVGGLHPTIPDRVVGPDLLAKAAVPASARTGGDHEQF